MTDDYANAAAATEERSAQAVPGADGAHCYQWNLTKSERCDPVTLRYQPEYVLPIVFVPGIMGSNLKGNGNIHTGSAPVWRLDNSLGAPLGLLFDKIKEGPGKRQKLLHPDRTVVDPGGAVPSNAVGSIANRDEYIARGWGEVGEGSYHSYLKFLEEELNGKPDANGVRKPNATNVIRQLLEGRKKNDPGKNIWTPLRCFEEPTEDELKALARCRMPVYACGYNWLDDNKIAAKLLLKRIKEVIARNHTQKIECKQVMIITHSMGGLVSRACAKLDGAEKLIAGIINGVMPANGAAVAYRRCKVGMWDESVKASLVIGTTGRQVTAVFAQAPGALELLPTQNYSNDNKDNNDNKCNKDNKDNKDNKYNRGWLEVHGPDGKSIAATLPATDPYEEIYKRNDRWWALVKEEWLTPSGGVPISWGDYLDFLETAKKFHTTLTSQDYHQHTHAFFGDADKKGETRSFERVTWKMTKGHRQPLGGTKAPTPAQVYEMSAQEVRMTGSNPERVGGERVINAETNTLDYETSSWDLAAAGQDGSGDGTVPASSGRAPLDCAKVLQVFKIKGVEHEPAYKDDTVQKLSLYSLCKLVSKSDKPAAVKP
ncbi:hypothetical protein QTI66_03460 [Variovorax sp. J22R133]|uniref:esterase/lipase family protein n=1 Tax=Variovorax brevis TaxID=3053503 RepID=UPI002576149B|nr:hypothetical protein [Variovorax sp. J22R133]MDM0111189.1 hypothetical protein [Variovorax sp. J22R133]